MPLTSSRKLKLRYGSCFAIAPPCRLRLAFAHVRAAAPNADTHNDELSRIRRPQSDFDVQPAQRPLALRVVAFVNPDVERLVGSSSEQPAIAPLFQQKCFEGPLQRVPQAGVVGFKDSAAQSFLDGFLHKQEEAAD